MVTDISSLMIISKMCEKILSILFLQILTLTKSFQPLRFCLKEAIKGIEPLEKKLIQSLTLSFDLPHIVTNVFLRLEGMSRQDVERLYLNDPAFCCIIADYQKQIPLECLSFTLLVSHKCIVTNQEPAFSTTLLKSYRTFFTQFMTF